MGRKEEKRQERRGKGKEKRKVLRCGREDEEDKKK